MNEGFFTKQEVTSKTRPDGKSYTCVSCGLYKNCVSSRMEPFGEFKKGIMNIGEGVSEIDDKYDKPFQGRLGGIIQKKYEKLGINLFEDCININVTNCYSKITPDNFSIECCRKFVLKYIEHYKPKVIILFGDAAVYSLLGHRWKRDLGSILKWRGWRIPDQDYKAFVCPVFSLNVVSYAESGEISTIWENDLKQALKLAQDDPFVFPEYKEPKIEFIHDLSVLKDIQGPVAFDYETTGLKPHGGGHRIICASVADSPDHVYTFFMPHTKKERKPFTDMLTDQTIKKWAQNMKFEHSWSEVRLNTIVEGWEWDTMLATHILDNRSSVTGLKFQTYVQFGIVDYSSEISPYLEAEGKNANAINRIFELLELPGGREKLLRYCALDSIFEYRLAIKQQSEMLLPKCE